MRNLTCTCLAVIASSLGSCSIESKPNPDPTVIAERCTASLKRSVALTEEAQKNTAQALAIATTWKKRYYMLKKRTGR